MAREKNWLESTTRPVSAEDRKTAIAQESHAERRERTRLRKAEAGMRKSVSQALARKHTGNVPSQSRHMRHANRVAEILHVLFGASLEVVKHRLREGHTPTATLIMTRYLDLLDDRIDEPISFDEDMTAAQKANLIVDKVAAGEIGLTPAKKLLEVLSGVLSLEVAEDLEDMRRQLAALGENTTVINDTGENPAAPSWGSRAKAERMRLERDAAGDAGTEKEGTA